MSDQPKQWQCGHCGAWVDAAWGRHVHVISREPSLEEMKALRAAGKDLVTSDEIIAYTRTGDEPMRDKPL